jgi:hypothetical protein
LEEVLRLLAAFAAICSAAWAQFDGLATPFDGSVVYFASTLRLKSSGQPRDGKRFVADEQGVRQSARGIFWESRAR